MHTRRASAHGVLVATLVLLHLSLRPLLTGWTGAPDLLSGGLLLASLRLRAGHAAALGFGLGLMEAALALTGLGPTALVYTLAGYAAARSRDLLFSDERAFLPLFLGGGVWAVQGALALVGGDLGPEVLFVAAPLSALSTTVVCWIAERMLVRLLV